MRPFATYLLRPVIFFAVTVVLFVLQRLCFVLFYPELFSGISNNELWQIVWYGLPMDCSMSAYLTIIPLLLSMVCLWLPERRIGSSLSFGNDGAIVEVRGDEALRGHKAIRIIIVAYSILIAFLLSFIAILDGGLYPVWGYKLDINPFFYFITSPTTAMGVMSGSQIFWNFVVVICVTILWTCAYIFSWNKLRFQPIPTYRRKIWTFIGLILMGGILFVTMRGGISVSTMNLSRAYFSTNQRLNHAAINPAFSLLSSATRSRSDDYDKYNFYPQGQLPELLSAVAYPAMEDEALWEGGDTIVSTRRPDIVLIILESFSSKLLPVQGGEDIAPNINREAENGLLFTNAYASGFRTDRGLPAILNGFPGLPDISITRYPSAMEHLPGLAENLPKGYRSAYYYGGDLNFTNMKALLIDGGFHEITGDTDFPIALRKGKWGVQDHDLFNRVKEEYSTAMSSDPAPRLTVIQTSSSHEPFNVPFSKFDNKAANAFAYTDSVVGDFMKFLRQSPRWNNTLVVMVPDHYGAYPENLPTIEERHHIPIIFSGGALLSKGRNDALMSQTDIAPTILGVLGIDNHKFFFGRNVFDLRTPPMVFYYDRGEAYLRSTEGSAIINTETMHVDATPSSDIDILVVSPLNPSTQLHAWLQAISDAYHLH